MLLRLLPIALLACSLFAAAPATAEPTCAGVSSGGSCIGAYSDCGLEFCPKQAYLCVGIYDGTCTGIQKP